VGRAAGAAAVRFIPNALNAEVNWVEIDVDEAAADADHRLDPDELPRGRRPPETPAAQLASSPGFRGHRIPSGE
jgi:hypothetical protein